MEKHCCKQNKAQFYTAKTVGYDKQSMYIATYILYVIRYENKIENSTLIVDISFSV